MSETRRNSNLQSHPRDFLFKIVAVACFLFVSAAVCRAQNGQSSGQQDYRLAADDVIGLFVLDEPTLSVSQLTVGQSGYVDLPVAGKVQVAGKTTREVSRAVASALAKWIKNPVVTVSVVQERPQLIAVSGDVQKPDAFDLKHVPRVLDAIAAAGWLKQPVPYTRAFLHRNGQRTEIHLADAIDNHDPAANLPLQTGDLITVEAQFINVYVDGLVRQPGAYEMGVGDGVLQAIAKAGGLAVTPDLVSASVRRNHEIIPVDLLKAAYDAKANLQLNDGDTVSLDEPKVSRVEVTGEVNKPGPYRLPLSSSSVLDAITAAGGLLATLRADSALINIVRENPGKPRQSISIDPVALLNAHDPTQNPQLQDGDVCVVSEIKQEVVFVNGEVKAPGAYTVREGDNVVDLVAQAGGPTDLAALTKVSVVHRDGTSVAVDIRQSVTNGGPKPDIAIQDGDDIVVPKNTTGVLVMQAVVKPGWYPMFEDRPTTVGDAIGLAGGTQPKAAIGKVLILRQTGGDVSQRVLDLRKSYDGQLATNLVLQNHDVVFVPDGKNPAANQGIIAGLITGLANIVALHG